jgi:hypothetical protein
MNRDEYLNYISEISELEAMLSEIPMDNVLERVSFEDRLKSMKSVIDNVKSKTTQEK